MTEDLVRRLEIPGPRYTSYPTVPEWSADFSAGEHAAALRRASEVPTAPLSLYVHIPFCREMCTYCGCNVIVTRDQAKVDRYLDALAGEAKLVAEGLAGRRSLSRVHLGGGTPTFLDEDQLLRLWKSITDHFQVRPDAEVALEIDPVVTRPAQLALLRSLGFRRLSMGVQDFDPCVQQAVNRIQTVAQTRAMLDDARALGFTSVNFDLIYGLPLQTTESWRRTLAQVVELRPDRVAAFSFAYVPEARPHQRLLPIANLPRGIDKLKLCGIAHEVLIEAGYRSIGMDHFALPGDELAKAQERGLLWRDFQGYTVERAADTVGIGVSAISDVGGCYAQNTHSLAGHASAIGSGRLATARGIALSDEDRRRRTVITDLMCNFSVDLGAEVAIEFAAELPALRTLEIEGLVKMRGSSVTLTPSGRLFVRNVAMVFDTYLRRPQKAAGPTFSSTV